MTSADANANTNTSSTPMGGGSHKDEAMAAVLHYLRKMGYRQTERLFREEAHIGSLETLAFELRNEQDSNISNYLLFGGTSQLFDLDSAYEEAYEAIKRWIFESLDSFREELLPILFPIFVHCYLDLVAKGAMATVGGTGTEPSALEERKLSASRAFLERFRGDHVSQHEDEINRLASITDANQLRENALAVAFRTNKYNVLMSAYTFQLLMTFLQDGTSPANVLILKIINQFINIRILVTKSATSGGAASAAPGLTGASAETASSLNRQRIQWGVHPVDPAQEAALQHRSKVESRLHEILQGPLAHMKRIYTQSSLNAPPADRIPKPPPSAVEGNAEIDRLRNMARKANLSALTLPSICLYTLHNTYDGVTCVGFAVTGALMATGNRDSFIDIWSLNHEPLRSIRPSTELAAMDLTDFESLEPMREFEGSLTKRLIGHSGPVYACKFFHPEAQRFAISVSQDETARLWSLDLFTCLVVFRGHSGPIWDVDVAPLGAGPYFVTASADRTARLWSCEQAQALRIFAGHLSDVDVVRFHPNGNYLVTGSADKTLRMWDIQSGACVRLFAGHSRGISSLVFSPDGRYLVSADRGGQLRIWDLAEGKLLRSVQLRGTNASRLTSSNPGADKVVSIPYSVELDMDGRILAVAGSDQMVRLFEMARLVAPAPAATTTSTEVSSCSSIAETPGLLASYPTKQTPILKLQFTYRNVLIGAGPYQSDD